MQLRKAKILSLLHSERLKLYTILVFLSALGLKLSDLLNENLQHVFEIDRPVLQIRRSNWDD